MQNYIKFILLLLMSYNCSDDKEPEQNYKKKDGSVREILKNSNNLKKSIEKIPTEEQYSYESKRLRADLEINEEQINKKIPNFIKKNPSVVTATKKQKLALSNFEKPKVFKEYKSSQDGSGLVYSLVLTTLIDLIQRNIDDPTEESDTCLFIKISKKLIKEKIKYFQNANLKNNKISTEEFDNIKKYIEENAEVAFHIIKKLRLNYLSGKDILKEVIKNSSYLEILGRLLRHLLALARDDLDPFIAHTNLFDSDSIWSNPGFKLYLLNGYYFDNELNFPMVVMDTKKKCLSSNIEDRQYNSYFYDEEFNNIKSINYPDTIKYQMIYVYFDPNKKLNHISFFKRLKQPVEMLDVTQLYFDTDDKTIIKAVNLINGKIFTPESTELTKKQFSYYYHKNIVKKLNINIDKIKFPDFNSMISTDGVFSYAYRKISS